MGTSLSPLSLTMAASNPEGFHEPAPLRLFAGNSNKAVAERVAAALDIDLGKARVDQFNDGEFNIQILENVRNSDVFILQSTGPPVNDNLMELLLMIRTFRRASARYITAVIPYFGYARQDRKAKPRVPISASDVSLFLEAAGVDRVVSLDLHCGQIQGFFHQTPVDNLFASVVFVPYMAAKDDLENVCVVSPDAGGVARAKIFMSAFKKLGIDSSLAMVIKQRAGAGQIASMNVVGAESVVNADCIIVDDIADTCGTLVRAAEELISVGARRVFACATHPVFSKDAIERLRNADALTEIVVTDTLELRVPPEEVPDKVTQLSISDLLADAVSRIHSGQSVSTLFK